MYLHVLPRFESLVCICISWLMSEHPSARFARLKGGACICIRAELVSAFDCLYRELKVYVHLSARIKS